MTLKEKVNGDIKEAMKSKDQAALRGLRAIKSAILLAETAEGRATGTELTPDEELKLLERQVKQRRDSAEQYRKAGRTEQAAAEEEEIAVISRYLPAQLSEAEVTAAVQAIITETGATTAKDLGKVMKEASAKLAGKADGKLVSEVAKRLLAT